MEVFLVLPPFHFFATSLPLDFWTHEFPLEFLFLLWSGSLYEWLSSKKTNKTSLINMKEQLSFFKQSNIFVIFLSSCSDTEYFV